MDAKGEKGLAEGGQWFCDRGDFWGTYKQFCLCAKCGKNEIKRHDEPRHYRNVFKPSLHMICDECFDSLPDEVSATPVALATKETANG